jgi:peptidoglycan hydrolase CwlO-like protein
MARRRRSPEIARILRGSGRSAGRPVKRLRPGMLLRIEGQDFGDKVRGCTVLFDDVEVRPHEMGFSPESFLVSAPLPPESTDTVRVRVDGTMSDPVECRLVRPGASRREPGSEILAYYAEVDELATATAALASIVAPATPFRGELERAASMLEGYRASLLRSAGAVRLCAAAQEGLDVPEEWAPLQSIRQMDEALRVAGSVPELSALRRSLYGPGGRVQQIAGRVGLDAADVLARGKAAGDQTAEIQEAFESSGYGLFGFILHEASKAMEGVEDLFDLFQPSLDAPPFDVTMDFGGAVSAVAKVVDIVGQIFIKIGADADSAALIGRLVEIERKIDQQETKLDGLDVEIGAIRSTLAALNELIVRIGTGLAGLTTAVGELSDATLRLEGKADVADVKLNQLEVKEDHAAGERSAIQEQLGLLEGKADAMAVQLGMQEEKMDRQEEKADRAEGKLDALETKSDRAEGKLDALETKADRAEGKLDSLEAKADRAEGKLDSLEAKADRAEGKLDVLEAKGDRAEGKLDALETKADRSEEKLDRHEVKLDRLRLPVPLEGTIAPQRGGGARVTAAVAVTGAADNRIYLRAAVDVDPDRLDDEAAWSAWTDFGRPTNAGGVLESSIDLAYEQGSDDTLSGLLSLRDETGTVYHRTFEAGHHDDLLDPTVWTAWVRFLAQPGALSTP